MIPRHKLFEFLGSEVIYGYRLLPDMLEEAQVFIDAKDWRSLQQLLGDPSWDPDDVTKVTVDGNLVEIHT